METDEQDVHGEHYGSAIFTREALAHLSHRNSVCPSVCPSHGWFSQKQCKLWSPNLHGRLTGRLQFQERDK